MSDLSTVDILSLIRAKMYEKQRNVNEMGRKLFSRAENLTKVFHGESTLSPKAFAAFVRELGVRDPVELRLWLGAFIVHKGSELLPIVERAGLLNGQTIPADAKLAQAQDDSWRVLSYHAETGELCGRALAAMAAAGRPLRAADISMGTGGLPNRTSNLLRKMEEDGLVVGHRRRPASTPKGKPFPPGSMTAAFPRCKVSPYVEWELTDLGREKLAQWREVKATQAAG